MLSTRTTPIWGAHRLDVRRGSVIKAQGEAISTPGGSTVTLTGARVEADDVALGAGHLSSITCRDGVLEAKQVYRLLGQPKKLDISGCPEPQGHRPLLP